MYICEGESFQNEALLWPFRYAPSGSFKKCFDSHDRLVVTQHYQLSRSRIVCDFLSVLALGVQFCEGSHVQGDRGGVRARSFEGEA
eukprot:896886-Rhodomonas_salina.1